MGFLSELKSKFSDAQSVWSGERSIEDLYSESQSKLVSSSLGSSDVVIGGFNVTSEVSEFLSVDKSDSDAVNAYIDKKKSEGWTEYEPTLGERIVDIIASAPDVLADVVEQRYGIDIVGFGSDEFGQEPVVSKTGANLLSLVFPVGFIGLLFLL